VGSLARDLPYQVTDLVAVEFGDLSVPVDVLQQVRRCAEERFERRFAVAPTEEVTVWRDNHFDEPGRRPVCNNQGLGEPGEQGNQTGRPTAGGTHESKPDRPGRGGCKEFNPNARGPTIRT
jgi:hypothetical protein